MWMLTGDKLETAKCISISTGLKSQKEQFFELHFSSKSEIVTQLQRYNYHTQMLFVDGDTLKLITEDANLKERFFNITANAKSVCICRCSPT